MRKTRPITDRYGFITAITALDYMMRVVYKGDPAEVSHHAKSMEIIRRYMEEIDANKIHRMEDEEV